MSTVVAELVGAPRRWGTVILMCFDVAVSTPKLNWSPFALFRTHIWPFFCLPSFTAEVLSVSSALDAVQVGVRPGTRGNPAGLGSVPVAPHEKFLKLSHRKRGRHGELVSCVVVAVTCVRVVSRSSPCCHRVVTAVVPV